MNRINNYNKEEHIQFIETLIKTEQVAVFINNMDISERSKVEQNDTLEYLYNKIIELQNNWNELKDHFKRETINLEIKKEDMSVDEYVDRKMFLKEVLNKMQELEQGK